MNLGDYLESGESVTVGTQAIDSEYPTETNKRGEVAATSERVVFSRGGYVADISLRSINSLEYKPPSYPVKYLYMGIGAMVVALGFWIFGTQVANDQSAAKMFAGLSAAVGIGFVVSGLFLRRHLLRIHTPSKSYSFTSKSEDLEEIAHAIRAHEPN